MQVIKLLTGCNGILKFLLKGRREMKKTRRIALLLACVLVVGVLGGCGNKFDARAYLQAMLDLSYKNDTTEFMDLKLGTAEEAAKVYESGVDTAMTKFLEGVTVSDELEAEFRQLVQDMYGNAKYTVDSAEKQDDEWVVTITYEKMMIFEAMLANYETAVTNLYTEWSGVADEAQLPTEEEMTDALLVALKDSMKDAIANAEYAEPATTTVKIELIDDVWTPNSKDIENLEMLLFDSENADF